jgi:alanine racemase
MDMTIVDVTDIPACKAGDEVILLGRDGEDEITVTTLARQAGTIPYEITCRLGRNLPREYIHPAIQPSDQPNVRESVISP